LAAIRVAGKTVGSGNRCGREAHAQIRVVKKGLLV
jgi:hypothetical protein